MVNLVGHLAKRGLEAVHKHHNHGQPIKIQLSLPALILLVGTAVAALVFISSIEYSIRVLMGHLAMVESPETTVVQVYTPAPASENDKKQAEAEGLLEVELESTTVASVKPLTASIRRTKRHLMNVGGFTARWRGLGPFVVYGILTAAISGLISKTFMRGLPMGETVADLAAALLGSRLHCAFTHKVISMPSSKKLYERKVSRSQWKQLLLPTAFSIFARDLTIYGSRAIIYLTGMSIVANHNSIQNKAVSIPISVVVIITGLTAILSLAIFVALPSYAALVRKEASLLPEEDETIVPVDRTFGGKVAQVGDVLSYKDAWKSFGSEVRTRVIKLYVKFFFITVAIMFAAFHVLALESLLVARDQVGEAAEVARQHLRARGF